MAAGALAVQRLRSPSLAVLSQVRRACRLVALEAGCTRTDRWCATAVKIDGTAIAKAVRAEVATETAKLKLTHGAAGTPGLAVLLVGERADSATYVRMKEKVRVLF